MNSKIYLIGLPGSGKTTLGKPLAAALKLAFVDLDKEIEHHEGKSIPSIFETNGEAYFREVESSLLKKWASSSRSFIMATGGGAPCFHNGIDVINDSGISIFIDTPITTIISRLAKATNRPLLDNTTDIEIKKQRLQELYTNRIGTYSKAKLMIQHESIDEIIGLIENFSK